jgi:hypothetical protein
MFLDRLYWWWLKWLGKRKPPRMSREERLEIHEWAEKCKRAAAKEKKT